MKMVKKPSNKGKKAVEVWVSAGLTHTLQQFRAGFDGYIPAKTCYPPSCGYPDLRGVEIENPPVEDLFFFLLAGRSWCLRGVVFFSPPTTTDLLNLWLFYIKVFGRFVS